MADLILQGESLYITLNMDVMDSAQAQRTGTHEVGGLHYNEMRKCLVDLVFKSNLYGFNLVEVAPPYDSSEITFQPSSSSTFRQPGFLHARHIQQVYWVLSCLD